MIERTSNREHILGFLDDDLYTSSFPFKPLGRPAKTHQRIAIIGGGLSGSLVALNLMRMESPSTVAVTIVEKERPAGVGVAYSTEEPHHLLNVPAGRMGAPVHDPGHFLRWLEKRSIPVTPATFVPRRLFGEYVRDLLVKASSKTAGKRSINRSHTEAVELHPKEDGSFVIRTSSGEKIEADKVVLALGNYPSANPRMADMSYVGSPFYRRNPWEQGVFAKLQSKDPVFIIGTGLTMVDAVLTLHHRNHKGPIVAVSTHGYIPESHSQASPYPSFHEEIRNLRSVLEIFRVVRKHIRIAESTGSNWRGVVDALRPYTQEIWISLSPEEKRTFLQHLRHLWGVARHRMPPECASIIREKMTTGQLRIEAGRVAELSDSGQSMRVSYVFRRDNRITGLDAAVVLNCTGPESHLGRIVDPLVQNARARGLIREDQFFLGIDALTNGSVIGRDGAITPNLFTLGPPLKGILWESTAVPEIRQQAHDLARLLLAGPEDPLHLPALSGPREELADPV